MLFTKSEAAALDLKSSNDLCLPLSSERETKDTDELYLVGVPALEPELTEGVDGRPYGGASSRFKIASRSMLESNNTNDKKGWNTN